MRVLVLVAIAMLAHIACGGAATRAPLEAQTLAVGAERACHEGAAALCARAVTCAPKVVDFFFGSKAYCELDVYSECARRYEGPGASPTPASCAADAEKIACESIKEMGFLYEIGAPLLLRHCPVTPGAFADNDDCLDDGDCASTFCAHEAKQACGRCRPAPKENEPCSGDQKCAAPLRCDKASRVCARLRRFTEPCGLACDGGWCAPDGHCELPLGSGVRCDRYGICDLSDGLVCSAKTNVCEPLSIVALEQPCDAIDLPLEPGKRFCAGGLFRNVCRNGICKSGRYETTAVTDGCMTKADCKTGGSCVNGHCRLACLP